MSAVISPGPCIIRTYHSDKPEFNVVAQIEREAEKAINQNDQLFYMWWSESTCESDREASAHFNLPISTLECVQLLMNPDAQEWEYKAAAMTLRDRFVDDSKEALELRAKGAA